MTALHPNDVDELTITPQTPTFGAVVRGIDTAEPVAGDDLATIKDALRKYKVLFFPGQNLTEEQQVTFACNFGEPHQGTARVAPEFDQAGLSSVQVVSNFHSDEMYRDVQANYSLLQMMILPPVGGDTMWADLVASYNALSEPIRAFLQDLTTTNVQPEYYLDDEELLAAYVAYGYGDNLTPEELKVRRNALRPHQHPLVRVLPDTGERVAWVSERHTVAINELNKDESDAVLSMLFRHQLKPQWVIRWNWTVGDLALWDQRATLHAGVNDYGDAKRRGHRVSVGTSSPVPASSRSNGL